MKIHFLILSTKENSIDEEEIKQTRKLFYEIEFPFLSENKFNEFIENLDLEYISPNIFQRLKKYIKYKISKENYPKTRYYEESTQIKSNHKEIMIEYDNNSNHRFKGIFDHLGNGNSKNVIDQKIILWHKLILELFIIKIKVSLQILTKQSKIHKNSCKMYYPFHSLTKI